VSAGGEPRVTRRGLVRGAALAGGAGAIATVIGFVVAPTQAAFAYLTAWTFALSIAIGALIFALIGHAVGARWVIVFRRFTEAIAGALPALALLFAPIAGFADRLYPWVAPSPALDAETRARLAHKAPYLNLPFWTIRAVGFLVLWAVLAEAIARLARDPRTLGRARALSAAGLPAVMFSVTFAAFDWLMSLTPLWYSTIFGLLYVAGGFVAALALIAVVARGARQRPAIAAMIRAPHTGALGRLVFAALVFWAYLEFSQGFLTWIANKPDEVPWYLARGAGGWGAVLAVLAVGHFALPFAALLPRAAKRRPTWLAIAGAWLVAMHYLDVAWLVMPVLHATPTLSWLDLAAPVAVLGLCTAVAAARARIAADPEIADAIAYEGT
jgi:hypothetical protein